MSICVGLSVSVVFLRSLNPKPLLTSSAFVKQPRFLSFSGISFLQSCLGSLSVLKLLFFFSALLLVVLLVKHLRRLSCVFSRIDLCLFNGLPDAALDDVIFVG